METNEQLNRIEGKIDHLEGHVHAIDITLAKQQVSLDDHISRTEMLEEQTKTLRENQIEFKGAVSFIKIIGVLAAIAEAIHMVIK